MTRQLLRRICSTIGIATIGLLVASGCATNTEDEFSEVDEEGESDLGVTQSELRDGTTDGCSSYCQPDGCVRYAMCRTRNDGGRALPAGATTFADKLRIANSSTGRKGCVAMIRTSRVYGHAAYVEDSWVSGGARRYKISEASWAHQYSCGSRTGTKAGLNISEFWCP